MMMAKELMFGREIIYFKAVQNFTRSKIGNTQQNKFLALRPQVPREPNLH